jgi:hypothetical protein
VWDLRSRKQAKQQYNKSYRKASQFFAKMKVQVLTILILAFAAVPTFGNDAGSHIDDESHGHATGDGFSDSSHERNANLRSTPRRAFEISVEEALRNESIPSVRNRRVALRLLFVWYSTHD